LEALEKFGEWVNLFNPYGYGYRKMVRVAG